MNPFQCDYYTRKADAAVFAIKTEAGRPIAAVGPLGPGEVKDNPVAHDFQHRGKPARHWNLRRDFIAMGRKWVRFGAQPRQQPKTTFRSARPIPDGRPRPPAHRTFAPGFILPGR